MKKIITLFVFACTIMSCKEIANAFNQSYIYEKGIELKFNNDSKKTVTANINGQDYNLYFDTGSGADVTINEAKFALKQDKILRQRDISGFDKQSKISSVYYVSDSISSKLFRLKNIPIFITGREEENCFRNDEYEGLINVLTDSDLPVELNYEKGYIKILDKLQTSPLGYTFLESKFSSMSSVFKIKLFALGRSDFFIFDTGNNGPILLNEDIYTPGKLMNSIDYIGNSVGGTKIVNRLKMYDADFQMKNTKFVQYVGVSQGSKRSIVNFNFIKKFNWIIDRKNKKVYYKIIDVEKLNNPYNKNHAVHAASSYQGKLIVSYSTSDSKFGINSEIISINNQNITPKNICEMLKLLNTTENWDKLNIQIKN
ncbi:hypothetical protein PGH12_01485 [Chryseobacterium wangxinyae]|uniref:hypothetical protein n=1 Tax=Chryseobacterium sp. CY350 TaxID=2997336 RepID=UPI00226E0419|nr:hypothetical protein [Chryseobacterium sp. CY350]MCY0977147.1 hypothetical protein [Chryseobacterium sp. CY350]WBZ95833.1 hypothetical protein PGH12_01485 [Chryseobacterium sp. CY350]